MVRTSRAGRFSVQLPTGKYQVADRSPRLLLVPANGIARQIWSRPVTVTVTGHHVTRITLVIAVPDRRDRALYLPALVQDRAELVYRLFEVGAELRTWTASVPVQ